MRKKQRVTRSSRLIALVTPSEHSRLTREADRRGITLGELVRRATEKYLAGEQAQAQQ